MDLRWLSAASVLLCLAGCRGSDGDLPVRYRDLAVPPALLQSQEAVRRGRLIYLEHCALCHGETGNGEGIRRNLSSRPADFTDPHWRERTSPRRVFFVINEGVQGTAMAGWKILTEDQAWDLVAYVMSLTKL